MEPTAEQIAEAKRWAKEAGVTVEYHRGYYFVGNQLATETLLKIRQVFATRAAAWRALASALAKVRAEVAEPERAPQADFLPEHLGAPQPIIPPDSETKLPASWSWDVAKPEGGG